MAVVVLVVVGRVVSHGRWHSDGEQGRGGGVWGGMGDDDNDEM